MAMLKRRQVQTTDSIEDIGTAPVLGEVGRQSNRYSTFDVEFWKANLAGAPPLLELPTDRPRPAVLSYAGGRVGLVLRAELTAGLRRLSQRHGATLFMTLVSGWTVLFSRLSGQSDIVLGTPVANRQPSDMEPLSGSSSNALALRVRMTPQLRVTDLLAQIKSVVQQAYAHQDVPFTEVVDALQLPCGLSYNPIFQVVLALEDAPEESQASGPAETIGDLPQEHIKAKFDLNLSMRDAGTSITGFLEYASDLFERVTIVRMAGQLRVVLEAMVADDQQCIGELNLLSNPEPPQLLLGSNATLPEGLPECLGGRTPGNDALADDTRPPFNAEPDAGLIQAEAVAATARERIVALEAEMARQAESLRQLRAQAVDREQELSAALRSEQQRNVELDAARAQAEAVAATAHERIAALEAEARRQAESLCELPVQLGAVHDSSVEAEAASSVASLGNIPHDLEHVRAEEPAHLLVPTNGESGTRYLLGKRTTIGRTADNDLRIDAQFISRRHAVALRAGVDTVIVDLRSTNGTFVNGQRVRRRRLKDGDLVTLGSTEFRFSVHEPPA